MSGAGARLTLKPAKLFTWAGRAWSDRRGAIALTFALSAMLILCAVFAAVDGARVSAGRMALQDALDSSILAAGASSAQDSATINKIGVAYLNAQLANNKNVQNVKAVYTPGVKSITVTATADVDPIFMDFFTGGKVHLTANSSVARGQDQTIELVLVLDTTGSMSGTKITTLRTAATSLVTKLTAGNAEGVKIGVVPFAQYVNVGVAARNESWVSVGADTSTTTTKMVTPSCVKSTTCTGGYTTTCTSNNDGVITTYSCVKGQTCTNVMYNPCPGPVSQTTTTTTKFNGCVGSPAYNKNVTDTDTSRKYPGLMNVTCSQQITPLTATPATVTTAIGKLTASGNTYIPAGLAWGFNMLSSPIPLTEAAAYDTKGPNRKPRKVMVLMTDGANTLLMRPATGAHDVTPAAGQRATQADTWMLELCANIRAQKIEVFTVAFDIGADAVSRDLVRQCATDNAHFYDAADQAALVAAFESIAASLQNLRLTK